MNLSLQHPIFDKPTHIVVTGTYDAKVYAVTNDEVSEIATFVTENPDKQYSDNEGHFQQGGPQGVTASGGVREEHKDVARKDFQKNLTDALKPILAGTHTLYVFTPEFMKNYTKETIEAIAPNNLETVFVKFGDYTSESPKDIVDMIIEYRSKDAVGPVNEEARKLLNNE